MSLWDFAVKLGSPAKPSKLETGIEEVAEIADRIAHPVYDRENMIDRLREAERSMRDA